MNSAGESATGTADATGAGNAGAPAIGATADSVSRVDGDGGESIEAGFAPATENGVRMAEGGDATAEDGGHVAADGAHAAEKPRKAWLNNLLTVLIVILFLAGAAIALYPAYSNLYNEYRNALAAIEYQETVDAAQEAAMQQELAEARAYNAEHRTNVVVDPFEKGKGGMPTDKAYEKLLDIEGNGIMGFIEIPKISQQIAVYHGTSAEVLDKGIGHLQGTSLPVGGESTHCVLSGHRGLPSAKLFTDLDQVEVGDQFYLHVCGEHLAYEVDDIKVVKPENVSGLAIQEGRDLVTLVTCTPYGVNTHRMLVRGHRVDYVPYEMETPAKWLAYFTPEVFILAAVLSVIVIVALVVFVRRLKRKGGGNDER